MASRSRSATGDGSRRDDVDGRARPTPAPDPSEPAIARAPRRRAAARAQAQAQDSDGTAPTASPSGGSIRRGLTLEQRRLQRRQDLLAAALELFGTKGYSATSIDEICRTAYVSTRNFYEEFTGREAVLGTLLDTIAEEVFDALAALHADAEPIPAGLTVAERIGIDVRRRLHPIVHTLLDDPRKARIVLIEAIDAAPEKGEWRRRYDQAMVNYLLDLFREILRDVDDTIEASLEDYVQPTAQRYIALSVVGAVSQILTDAVVRTDPAPIEETIDFCTYAVVRLLNVDGVERIVDRVADSSAPSRRGPRARARAGS